MQRLCPALVICMAIVVAAGCGGSGKADCSSGSQYKVGQGSGNAQVFVKECQRAGGDKAIGEPRSEVEAWHSSCIQHFVGGTEVESTIFELTASRRPDCSQPNPFPGSTYIVGGRFWHEYAYVSGCASRTPTVIGAPISEAEPPDEESPITQTFRTPSGRVHKLVLEETTGLVRIVPGVDCRLHKAK